MSALREAMEQYLSLRRSLGFKLIDVESTLRSFIAFAEREAASHVTTGLALRWVKLSTAKESATLAGRLNIVRRFAIWRSAADMYTEVPPKNLMPYRYHRKPPYIYSDEQIERLVATARKLPSPKGLRGPTYATLFGLIAATGMRISEAVSLDKQDVDLEEKMLSIRDSKFRKSRLVPVHVTTRDALSDYSNNRDRVLHRLQSVAFFVSERGTRITAWAARDNFAEVSRQIGLRKQIKGKRVGCGPRLHDMRHRFAARTLVDWYRAGINVEREIHKLSTYLGHAHVNDTYWYLEALPELLELATQKLMIERKETGDDD
jgi:site-specific recombinase XerD